MHLTPRQRQALLLLRNGSTYTQAAAAMGLARSSVSSLLNRACQMNGFSGITDLRKATLHTQLDKPPALKRSRRIKGVYLIHTGKYKATLSVKGRSVHVGCYGSEAAAWAARVEAEKKYRGANISQ